LVLFLLRYVRDGETRAAHALLGGSKMDRDNEHIDNLIAAREVVVTQRRNAVDALSRPYERGNTQDAKQTFMAAQATIEAIDRALADERQIATKPGLVPTAGF
jgi:hypothetical protein